MRYVSCSRRIHMIIFNFLFPLLFNLLFILLFYHLLFMFVCPFLFFISLLLLITLFFIFFTFILYYVWYLCSIYVTFYDAFFHVHEELFDQTFLPLELKLKKGKNSFDLPQLLHKFDLPPSVRKPVFKLLQLLKPSNLPPWVDLRVVLGRVWLGASA
jgi:hypothetical protein